jgi:hypothetical protein
MAEQVGEMILHIATASTQQSGTTEQVSGSMEQIANLIKESAVGARQSAKACHELSGLALDLQETVSRFKLAANTKSGIVARRHASREGFDVRDTESDLVGVE